MHVVCALAQIVSEPCALIVSHASLFLLKHFSVHCFTWSALADDRAYNVDIVGLTFVEPPAQTWTRIGAAGALAEV